ncbi:MAG: M48 family metalloprotease [Pseudorhodoplanes sp.]
MLSNLLATRWTKAASRLTAILTAASLVLPSLPARAQFAPAGMPIIRDAEIEQLLRDYTLPILRAAGLAQQNVQVVIINDRGFNAFVMDGRRIFINAGALLDARAPNEVIGVLAHETGHIAGGHLSKMREQMANAQTMAVITMLLGMGAIAAGATSGNANTSRNMGNIGSAALQAPQEAIRRTLLSYIRQQEDQADRAAVKFLNATGQSAKGMSETFKRLSEQILFASQGANPYLQTHPMPAERVAALEGEARRSPYWDKKDSPELQMRHDLMRAKLSGFLERNDAVLRRYPPTDMSLPARYARAISSYRFKDVRGAITQIDALIQMQPQNPYFDELKGQALLESGRPQEAIAPLRRAIAMTSNSSLIQIMLGQALLAASDNKHPDEAINLLRSALAREPEVPEGYTQLAMAYGQKGDLAQADLASAQAAYSRGDVKTARALAARAKTRFPVGSPGWVKADDIVTVKPQQSGQRR